MEFDLPPKAAPEVIAGWNHLADRVCRELARAGLPAYRGDLDGGPQGGPGAEVHVDPLADGGVYVDWRPEGELTTAVVAIFARGIDYTDPPPIVRHHRDVHQFMREALLGILASAGFQAEKGDPHLGIAVHVKGLRP
ncbi:hypothetical protein ACIO8G_12310 [Streptomyces sp. NPDC087219]|uniref:hypothetical protein n=1 Tax=unclassified Streptomyces TaxID=2593676 RepID=UPI0037FE2CB1